MWSTETFSPMVRANGNFDPGAFPHGDGGQLLARLCRDRVCERDHVVHPRKPCELPRNRVQAHALLCRARNATSSGTRRGHNEA